jgi:two-component SAPR family response regulator
VSWCLARASEYVPVESEIVYLDPSLVHVESIAFVRQSTELLGRNVGSTAASPVLHSYRGKFAPEFEYEEWAIRWREQAHAVFLDLTEQASRARLRTDRPAEATALLRHALEIDPEAVELEPLMAIALHLSGSHAAARQTYAQYVVSCQRDFGESPPPFDRLLEDLAKERREPPDRPGSGRGSDSAR